MLSAYKNDHSKKNLQYILVNSSGKIIEYDNQTIIACKGITSIQEAHPFFESLEDLFSLENETFEFSCINIETSETAFILDIKLDTSYKSGYGYITLENLTDHYNEYQRAAQIRNEFIINSQYLELSNKHIKEKEAFKTKFLSNFSHQLRNPITMTTVFSEILSETDLTSEQKNYIDIISSASRSLKNRVDDMLELSKIESGKLVLREHTFNFREFIEEIKSNFRILCNRKQIEFLHYVDPEIPEFIYADPYRIEQILGNLLRNALSYTSSGEINLNIYKNFTRAQKVNINIEVIDTGIGIDKKYHEVIFDRFNSLSNLSDRNFGLGLSIVKHLSEQMGGRISVDSEIDKGSKFVCNLSLKISTQKKLTVSKTKEYPKLTEKKAILLIEDSELIQLSILKILSSDGNFFLNIVSNGEDVVEYVKNIKPDLIIVSNTIQKFSAETITKNIKSLPRQFKRIPVLALSTEVFKEDIKRFKEAGIKDVIAKPFNKEDILDKLYKYLKK
ncbi:MAG: hypothetical protein CMO82_03350 [Winogradskyella sp.]|nr:hypothetical protein [Winogradskyella sp.]|tara:strand:- start:1128 stop:2639 length:1512 start_codon:yes stop_codon:yes gene_type:complete